jgi:PilZ domain
MQDRRRDSRLALNTVGAIKFGAAGHELPCTVVDLTPRGAGLIVASAFGVPRVFQLTIKGETGVKYCRVIWAEGGKLGVTFE